MVGFTRKLVRRFGYDIAPFPGGAKHWTQIISLLARHEVDCVLDVGANVGQYANAIRKNGYQGRIVSFEPLSDAHAKLTARAAGDDRNAAFEGICIAHCGLSKLALSASV